jgi:hypothetical protein
MLRDLNDNFKNTCSDALPCLGLMELILINEMRLRLLELMMLPRRRLADLFQIMPWIKMQAAKLIQRGCKS